MSFIKATGALSFLLALDWAGHAAAYPTQLTPRASPAGPTALKGGNLQMIPASKFRPPSFVASPADFALKTSDSWFFGQGDAPIAVVVGTAANANTRFLSGAQFSDSLTKVTCSSSSTVDVKFSDAKALAAAQQSWSWLTQSASNSIIFIGDASCGKPDASLYRMSAVAFDAKALTARLTGQSTQWKSALDTFTVQLDSAGLDVAPGSTALRSPSSLFSIPLGSASKEVNVPLSLDLSGKPLFSKQFGNASAPDTVPKAEVSLTCAQCGVTGQLHFRAAISAKVGSGGGAQALVALDARDLAVSLGLGLKLAGKVEGTASEALPPIPLLGEPVSIPGIVALGPELVIGAAASFAVEASVELGPLGGRLSFPANPHAELSIGTGGKGPVQSGWAPQFDAFTPQIAGQVEGTAEIAPFVALGLDISSSLFDKGASAGLVGEAPKLTLGFKAQASSGSGGGGGVCGSADAKAGVSFNAQIGGDLSLFAGAKPMTESRDIKVATVGSVSVPVVDKCFPIGGSGSGSGSTGGGSTDTGPAGKIFVVIFNDADFKGKSQKFNSAQDKKCQSIAPEFRNQVTSLRLSKSTTPATGGCLFYRDLTCSSDPFIGINNQQLQNFNSAPGTSASNLNDALQAFKCCNDLGHC